jgi:hypothetical protein
MLSKKSLTPLLINNVRFAYNQPPLVLLTITFFPKCVLAPATEKSDGETGVLLATGHGKREVFHQECENH